MPDCSVVQCGSDGCEGSCGTCASLEKCSDAGQCICTYGKCGGLCCSAGQSCHNSICCTPQCAGKDCGDNACGGSCGDCGSGGSCYNGSCVCGPQCSGKECGSDGCGGSCGSCGAQETCNDAGQCVYDQQSSGCVAGGGNVPAEMVCIEQLGILIDRYEASKGSGNKAVSVKGASPWTAVSWEQATAGCAAAGKRLCTKMEWMKACKGPSGSTFPYGDEYNPLACAGMDYFDNQGCTNYSWCTEKTGAATGCEGGYTGLFDMSGNKQEWTSFCVESGVVEYCSSMGGNATSVKGGLTCQSGEEKKKQDTETSLQQGFRCCKTP
jgi:hypothetical protein